MTAKLAMPLVPTKWDALDRPREEYVGEFPKFPGDANQRAFSSPEYTAWREAAEPEIQAHRQRETDWDRAARNAMATGRMTPEQVTALGYQPMNHETDGDWGAPKWGRWRPLPQTLYHTTTNLPGIAASGRLLAPDELDLAGKGRGLGGGSQDTISFTDSAEEAENIRRAMLEGADVASGRLPIERMVEMARTGEGANEPWLRKMFGDYDWSKGNPRGLDDLLLGREPFYSHKLPEDHPLKGAGYMHTASPEEWAQHGFQPYPDAPHLGTPEAPKYMANHVYRDLSPQEKATAAFEWWRNPWAPFRSWSGGPSDPMFTSVDPQWFANLDPSHVGVVQATPVPGGHGYPMSSLGEWRVPTGDAVQITHINGQPYTPRTAKTAATKPLYVRWVYSPATRDVQLADNNTDPLNVRYHTDLAREINEPNLIHGYATPIGGGWRLSDWENHPVEDADVIAQVMRKLRGEHGSWEPEPVEDDWSRIHHGLPA